MVVSVHCEAVLELGRKLTRELNMDQSVDTLGRWMAHYIAELIVEAEKAIGEERPEKMRVCCEAILNLWKYRHILPDGKRPFEEIEPLLRVLESLDPENETPRYFHSLSDVIDDDEENDETKSWLKLIVDLDYSAKILIRYCLVQAAQNALNKSREWVSLAEEAGADEIVEYPLIRLIYDEDCMIKEPNANEIVKKRIGDRINRLEGFIKMANGVLSDLQQEVQQTEDTQDEC